MSCSDIALRLNDLRGSPSLGWRNVSSSYTRHAYSHCFVSQKTVPFFGYLYGQACKRVFRILGNCSTSVAYQASSLVYLSFAAENATGIAVYLVSRELCIVRQPLYHLVRARPESFPIYFSLFLGFSLPQKVVRQLQIAFVASCLNIPVGQTILAKISQSISIGRSSRQRLRASHFYKVGGIKFEKQMSWPWHQNYVFFKLIAPILKLLASVFSCIIMHVYAQWSLWYLRPQWIFANYVWAFPAHVLRRKFQLIRNVRRSLPKRLSWENLWAWLAPMKHKDQVFQ